MSVCIQDTLENRFPDREWKSGCDDFHAHYITVLEEREFPSQHLVLEVAQRHGTLEVNIVDHREEGDKALPYTSQEPPKDGDDDYRDQIERLVWSALRQWPGETIELDCKDCEATTRITVLRSDHGWFVFPSRETGLCPDCRDDRESDKGGLP